MAIAGLTIVGRPFALWPATLQMMPGGLLDAGFQRFFVGVSLSNTSAQAWLATEARLSTRGRQILAAAAQCPRRHQYGAGPKRGIVPEQRHGRADYRRVRGRSRPRLLR